MKRLILLVLLAALAGCIPGKIVHEEGPAAPAADSAKATTGERRPPASAKEEPEIPEDLAPVIEVSDEGEAEIPAELIREHYVIEGSSSELVRAGDPRVSRIQDVYGFSDSLEFWGDLGTRTQSDRPERDEIRLEGNAKIIDRMSIITGEEGLYSPLTRIALMLRNVEILDEGVQIHCQRASWDRHRRRSLLTESVSIDFEGKKVFADSVLYDQRNRYAEAFGNVRVIDPGSDTRILGDHGSFDLENEITIMDLNPVFFMDEDGDSTHTTARVMRHFRSDSLMVAVGDVHYRSEQLEAFGDSALFFQARDRMDLFQNPRLLWNGNHLSGDSLHLFLKGREPEYMEVVGRAVYLEENPDSSFFDGKSTRIEGERFDIFFADGDLKEVRVTGPASSVYVPSLEPGEVAQLHETRGDSMNFVFAGEDLESVEVLGASSGQSWSLDNWEADYAGLDTLVLKPFIQRAGSYKYRADSILFEVMDEEVFLMHGPAEIEDDFHLKADSIHLQTGEEYLTALGDPVFKDGDQELYGVRMEYDLSDSEGMVFDGVTTLGSGFFSGPRMKKVGDEEINVSSAVYTTCDLPENPHSGFYMNKVKAEGDKVYAAPVTLKIGKVPVFVVPTFFLDLKKGRRSGVLVPNFEFGINAERQRFIRNLGYYFAFNDYTDLLLRGDYVEDGSVLGSTTFRYNRRYWRGGSFSGDWRYDVKRDLGEAGGRSWGLLGAHSMTLGNDTRISAKGNYASSSNLREIDNYTVDETINQRLSSSLNASTKLFGKLPFSTGFNMTQHLGKEDEDSSTDNLLRDVSTPVSLSWPGLSLPLGLGLKLTLPSFKYSRNSKTYETRNVVSESIPVGTSLSRSFNLLGVTLRPSAGTSISFRRSSEPARETVLLPFGPAEDIESGIPASPEGQSGLYNEISTETSEGWQATRSNTAGLSASIKWFGLFYPGENMPSLGPITAMRHTFAPSTTFSYSENFSESGRSVSRSLSLSLDQSLDFKTGSGENQRVHNGILTWALKTTFNPALWPDLDPWGRLTSNLRLKPGKGVSVQMNHSWDPNTWELESSNLSGSFSKTLRVSIGSFLAKEALVETEEPAAHRPVPKAGGGGVPLGVPGGFGSGNSGFGGAAAGGGAPGELSLNSSFSVSRSSSGQLSPNLRLNSGFQLSDNWSLAWSGDLQLEEGGFGTQRLSVIRDLHCWEAQFTSLIFQGEPQYYFLIFLREHSEVKQEFGNRGVSGQTGLY